MNIPSMRTRSFKQPTKCSRLRCFDIRATTNHSPKVYIQMFLLSQNGDFNSDYVRIHISNYFF